MPYLSFLGGAMNSSDLRESKLSSEIDSSIEIGQDSEIDSNDEIGSNDKSDSSNEHELNNESGSNNISQDHREQGKPCQKAGEAFAAFVDTIAALRAPDGCPWDREQTHDSIAHNMIEEAYEAVDDIEKRDLKHLREELGDVLLQVVLQSQIAADAGEFDVADVCQDVNEKMIRSTIRFPAPTPRPRQPQAGYPTGLTVVIAAGKRPVPFRTR